MLVKKDHILRPLNILEPDIGDEVTFIASKHWGATEYKEQTGIVVDTSDVFVGKKYGLLMVERYEQGKLVFAGAAHPYQVISVKKA